MKESTEIKKYCSRGYLIPQEVLQSAQSAVPNTQFINYPDVLTVAQTAELMGLCKNTIYKLIKEKRLPSRKIGTAIRIRKKDIISFLKTA